MKSISTEELLKLANLIFKKTGLASSIESIKNEIESELEGAYSRIDSEDDDEPSSYPSYGGVVYDRYSAIENGELSYELNRDLSKEQIDLLFRFIDDNNLEISVERTDYSGQVWSFELKIPFVLNKQDCETFTLNFSIKLSAFGSNYEIDAYTWDELTQEQISKIFTMYSLQL